MSFMCDLVASQTVGYVETETRMLLKPMRPISCQTGAGTIFKKDYPFKQVNKAVLADDVVQEEVEKTVLATKFAPHTS